MMLQILRTFFFIFPFLDDFPVSVEHNLQYNWFSLRIENNIFNLIEK